jgi:hypothetical protein
MIINIPYFIYTYFILHGLINYTEKCRYLFELSLARKYANKYLKLICSYFILDKTVYHFRKNLEIITKRKANNADHEHVFYIQLSLFIVE